jgi:predicted nucleic acid-binding protein
VYLVRHVAVILVDSSIWIAAERGLISLRDVVPVGEIVAACPAIVHEVLRGTQTAKQFQLARDALMKTEMLDSPTPFSRFEDAAKLYFRCRKGGFTASAMDCLIASCAIANRVPLLHQDSDFDFIAGCDSSLKIFTRSSS